MILKQTVQTNIYLFIYYMNVFVSLFRYWLKCLYLVWHVLHGNLVCTTFSWDISLTTIIMYSKNYKWILCISKLLIAQSDICIYIFMIWFWYFKIIHSIEWIILTTVGHPKIWVFSFCITHVKQLVQR